ncbi:cation-translocating P-type ATPase [Pedobacter immunditicola]|uniref:cation-translocating P-type ATPase n=1 Tax=Pedobacter immunditicola TaxID=3133440 RepID=UPI0030B7333A
MKEFYQSTYEEVIKELETAVTGLKKEKISGLQNKYGKNVLKETKQKSRLTIFLSQFKDIMIIILIVAAGISFAVGEHTDAYVILAIIIANAWIGYTQEYNAEESVRLLQKMSAQYALVLRDNNPEEIDAAELVPGDILLLEAGDIVPSDARLFQISSIKTDEAALTGESHSVEKTIDPLSDNDLGPGDQLNMVFKGTIVSNGTAKAIVTTTGMNTEIGKIAGMMDVGKQHTPLQKRLGAFSKQMAVGVIVICIVVFVMGLSRGEPAFIMFLTALSLAVAALPEALPAVVTIALSKGANRMVKQKALMRKLPAVETLGSVTFICSDKTGTLTQNIMTVEKMQSTEGQEELLKYAMMLDNEVRFSNDGNILGDSTETALVSYALENGIAKAEADGRYPLIEKLPFDSVRMRMSSLHQHQQQWILFVKGAPVKVTEALANEYKDQSQKWLDINREYAADGLRVLFFGYKIFDEKPAQINEDLEKDLSFLGLAAMIDPPREEVIDAIRECKQAGIKTVMITGDQPLTAQAIAERLQMIDKDAAEIMTGADLTKITDEEFSREIQRIAVYARVSPEQKLRIVKTLQEQNEFVAMTGDGVNDAPSLKQADIGIAMGITGTDVSKDAADMILLDDNFATIVKAVKEGRRIYENIKKFILYVLSCNLAEILTLVAAPLLGMAIPLLPIHILWINLVTDGLPGLALTSQPAEKGIMERPPRPPKESLFAGGMIPKILCTGAMMAVVVLFAQQYAASSGYDVSTQQTMVFTLLCFIQLGNAVSVRQTYNSMFKEGFSKNKGLFFIILITMALQLLLVYVPFLQPIFKTVSLDQTMITVILIATVIGVLGIELLKFFINKFYISKKKGINANHIK